MNSHQQWIIFGNIQYNPNYDNECDERKTRLPVERVHRHNEASSILELTNFEQRINHFGPLQSCDAHWPFPVNEFSGFSCCSTHSTAPHRGHWISNHISMLWNMSSLDWLLNYWEELIKLSTYSIHLQFLLHIIQFVSLGFYPLMIQIYCIFLHKWEPLATFWLHYFPSTETKFKSSCKSSPTPNPQPHPTIKTT